jgi:hypothetical protein
MKLPSTGIVKYHVKLKFEVDGLVEKADIIGAIFGQTEGLLGPEMNLNELQKVSKVGRIEVNVDTKSNMAKGDAVIPMSTDISTAALIAAAIESIDKVGPFQAKFGLSGIDDIRAIKKKVIVDRAKKIVQEWATKTISEGEEMLKDVYDASKPGKLTAFGKAQLACGTGVFDSDWIILVEGRAKVIAFLDGDRAGDLILKELHGVVNIDKVLRAPTGREVEECTPLEIAEILKEGMLFAGANGQEGRVIIPQQQQPERRQNTKRDRQEQGMGEEREIQVNSGGSSVTVSEDNADILSAVKEVYPQINETLEAVVLDGSMKILLKVPVSDVVKKLDRTEGAKLLVLDGIVTQRLVDAADKVGIEYIVGHRTADLKKSTDVRVRTFGDMGINN